MMARFPPPNMRAIMHEISDARELRLPGPPAPKKRAMILANCDAREL